MEEKLGLRLGEGRVSCDKRRREKAFVKKAREGRISPMFFPSDAFLGVVVVLWLVCGSHRTNLVDVKQELLGAKKDEITHLTSMLAKVEEQNGRMNAQIDLLKKERLDSLGTADAVQKSKSSSRVPRPNPSASQLEQYGCPVSVNRWIEGKNLLNKGINTGKITGSTTSKEKDQTVMGQIANPKAPTMREGTKVQVNQDAKTLLETLDITVNYKNNGAKQCSWLEPREGMVKLNLDGSLTDALASIGGIIRDSKGDVALAYTGAGGLKNVLY
ncbi:hypothetical protein IFM89_019869 [Coptis chinensis]|uniref:Uncharacterized protein n=1 Tax=Coptis chinensis TaxID=261450 RepID=A0A835MA44_9MAGN|nr:hypothetical protein IFM89_019869 [Coptis chinensis]